jgi:ATP sulfurylase
MEYDENEIALASLSLRNWVGSEIESATVFSRRELVQLLTEWSETMRYGDTITVTEMKYLASPTA